VDADDLQRLAHLAVVPQRDASVLVRDDQVVQVSGRSRFGLRGVLRLGDEVQEVLSEGALRRSDVVHRSQSVEVHPLSDFVCSDVELLDELVDADCVDRRVVEQHLRTIDLMIDSYVRVEASDLREVPARGAVPHLQEVVLPRSDDLRLLFGRRADSPHRAFVARELDGVDDGQPLLIESRVEYATRLVHRSRHDELVVHCPVQSIDRSFVDVVELQNLGLLDGVGVEGVLS